MFLKFIFLITVLFSSYIGYANSYWVSGKITEYHVHDERIIVEINNIDDSKCGGYNWYGDYSLEFPDPAEDASKAMMASHKAQVLFSHFENENNVRLYVSESSEYCKIMIVTYDEGS